MTESKSLQLWRFLGDGDSNNHYILTAILDDTISLENGDVVLEEFYTVKKLYTKDVIMRNGKYWIVVAGDGCLDGSAYHKTVYLTECVCPHNADNLINYKGVVWEGCV